MEYFVIYCPRRKVSYMSKVTFEQRYTIGVMLQQNFKQIDIAKAIGKDKSVVSREIKRNCDNRNGEYRSDLAQRKRDSRQKERIRYRKLDETMSEFINEKLAEKWSPEQISNRCKKDNIDMVSHERIYQYIIADKDEGGELYKQKRRKKKYASRLKNKECRGKIKGQTSITERPKIVEEKTRFGDLEVDLIIGENHKGALITINDRRTGYAKRMEVVASNNLEGQAVLEPAVVDTRGESKKSGESGDVTSTTRTVDPLNGIYDFLFQDEKLKEKWVQMLQFNNESNFKSNIDAIKEEVAFHRDRDGLVKECLQNNIKSVKEFYELADAKYPLFFNSKKSKIYNTIKAEGLKNQGELFIGVDKNTKVIKFLWDVEYEDAKKDPNLHIVYKPESNFRY